MSRENYFLCTFPPSQSLEIEECVQAMASSSFEFRREGLERQVGTVVAAG